MGFSDYIRRIQQKRGEKRLIRDFEKHVGMTPTDYINHHRIECSKLILADEKFEELAISELAKQIGYGKDTEKYIALFEEKGGDVS